MHSPSIEKVVAETREGRCGATCCVPIVLTRSRVGRDEVYRNREHRKRKDERRKLANRSFYPTSFQTKDEKLIGYDLVLPSAHCLSSRTKRAYPTDEDIRYSHNKPSLEPALMYRFLDYNSRIANNIPLACLLVYLLHHSFPSSLLFSSLPSFINNHPLNLPSNPSPITQRIIHHPPPLSSPFPLLFPFLSHLINQSTPHGNCLLCGTNTYLSTYILIIIAKPR